MLLRREEVEKEGRGGADPHSSPHVSLQIKAVVLPHARAAPHGCRDGGRRRRKERERKDEEEAGKTWFPRRKKRKSIVFHSKRRKTRKKGREKE